MTTPVTTPGVRMVPASQLVSVTLRATTAEAEVKRLRHALTRIVSCAGLSADRLAAQRRLIAKKALDE